MTAKEVLDTIRGAQFWFNYYDIYDKDDPNSIINEIKYVDDYPEDALLSAIERKFDLENYTNEELLKLFRRRPDQERMQSIQVYDANNDLILDKNFE